MPAHFALLFQRPRLADILPALQVVVLVVTASAAPGQVKTAESDSAIETKPSVEQRVEVKTLGNGTRLAVQVIPGVQHTALMMQLNTGADHDPSDAAGLAFLLAELALKAPAEDQPARTATDLRADYPFGFGAQALHDRTLIGVVVPVGEAADVGERLARRVTSLEITGEVLEEAVKAVEADAKRRFEEVRIVAPAHWAPALAFPNASDSETGIDIAAIRRLRPQRVLEEWARRVHPSRITVIVVGAELDPQAWQRLEEAWGAFEAEASAAPIPSNARRAGAVQRNVTVPALPGDAAHPVAAYYAPPINDPDHPGFATVAAVLSHQAAKELGAQGRMPFQYAMFLDGRAAYLTPHTFSATGGAAGAMARWEARLERLKFGRHDGRTALAKLGWEIGAPLPGPLVEQATRRPNLLYTIAAATAFRLSHGDEAFWSDYRDRMAALTPRELDSIKQRHFAPENRGLWILKSR